MGNLYDGTFNDDIKTYFSKVHVYSKEGCRSCWAKFFCSGGCNANSFIYEGDVKKPYKIACEMQKKRLECAIALAADRAVKGHSLDERSSRKHGLMNIHSRREKCEFSRRFFYHFLQLYLIDYSNLFHRIDTLG